MNEQVIKEAEELIESFVNYVDEAYDEDFGADETIRIDNQIRCAIKTQERVVSELELIYNAIYEYGKQPLFIVERTKHNKEILNHLKSLL